MFKLGLLLISFIPCIVFGQIKSIGTPYVNNYLKSDYNAGTQNWGIASGSNGFMYFANNKGLLHFDGENWELYKSLNGSALRSVCVDKTNTVYVGAYNDFGYLKNNKTGKPSYESLRHLLPAGVDGFDDVWRVFETSFGIVFQSFNYIFIYKDDHIHVLTPESKFQFIFYENDRLFFNEPGIGLFEYKDDIVRKLDWANEISNEEIWTILPYQNNCLLIGTEQNGLYLLDGDKLQVWDKPVNALLKRNKIYCAAALSDSHFAFGTILGGLIIADDQGNVLQQIDQQNGLQNNTILSMYPDENGNLWLGLDNGIDYVEITSPVSFISNISELGTGYTALVFNDNLYLGTNQGLFVKPFNSLAANDGLFELVENTAGQVWSLQEFKGQLICGHNLGVFLIQGKKAKQISQQEGAWKFISLKNRPNYLLGGFYNGLALLKKGENDWVFHQKIEGFNESTRFLCQGKDESFWISHGTKGIFHIMLDENFQRVIMKKLYNQKDGLPSTIGNVVFELDDDIFVSTISGVYQLDYQSDKFLSSEKYNQLFDIQGRLMTFKTDEKGSIWFISDEESGFLRLNEDLTYTKITAPFKRLGEKLVDEFEFLYPYDKENVFWGVESGFAHYSTTIQKSYFVDFQSFITKVELPYLDSIIYFNQIQNVEADLHFIYRKNSFRFFFTSNFFETINDVEYSYMLENYSDEWSKWTSVAFKDFTNLIEGDYVLKVKARNAYGTISSIASFQFSIAPPFYRSTLAWCLYLTLFLVLGFLIVNVVFKRFQRIKANEKEQRKKELQLKEEQFERERIIAEKEIIALRNEKLQNEMVYRDKELANQTMNLIAKNKLLSSLKDELQRIQSATKDGLVKTKMAILRNRIEKEIDNNEQNKIFETYFEEVHADFFNRIKEKYPQLSPKDLRLCAYIRMDMSTKEISALLNITYRGAEINRYRLRKKLDLSREVNLATFLSNI